MYQDVANLNMTPAAWEQIIDSEMSQCVQMLKTEWLATH
jgi:hypothetical protein